MDTRSRVFVALDGLTFDKALALVRKVTDSKYTEMIAGFKIHDLWDAEGPMVVNHLCQGGAINIWADLKLHDVPATVRHRTLAVARSGAQYLTVHASGGIEMMKQAVTATSIRIVAITVLTSLSEDETHLLCGQPAKSAALMRARLAKFAGVYAVVCSAHEVGALSKCSELTGLDFIVPGIRLAGKGAIDSNQKRVDTPAAAFKAGATRIVVGSEITKAEDPIAVLATISAEIESVEGGK